VERCGCTAPGKAASGGDAGATEERSSPSGGGDAAPVDVQVSGGASNSSSYSLYKQGRKGDYVHVCSQGQLCHGVLSYRS
jgi:hypothetical protein